MDKDEEITELNRRIENLIARNDYLEEKLRVKEEDASSNFKSVMWGFWIVVGLIVVYAMML